MASQPGKKPPQATAPALGTLPEWDLRDLYPGRDSAELKRDLDASEAARPPSGSAMRASSRRCRARRWARPSPDTSGCRRRSAAS